MWSAASPRSAAASRVAMDGAAGGSDRPAGGVRPTDPSTGSTRVELRRRRCLDESDSPRETMFLEL